MSDSPFPKRWFDGYIFDLDGTVYLGEALLPTAGETLMRLRERGISSREQRSLVDAEAAAVILQGWLEARR